MGQRGRLAPGGGGEPLQEPWLPPPFITTAPFLLVSQHKTMGVLLGPDAEPLLWSPGLSLHWRKGEAQGLALGARLWGGPRWLGLGAAALVFPSSLFASPFLLCPSPRTMLGQGSPPGPQLPPSDRLLGGGWRGAERGPREGRPRGGSAVSWLRHEEPGGTRGLHGASQSQGLSPSQPSVRLGRPEPSSEPRRGGGVPGPSPPPLCRGHSKQQPRRETGEIAQLPKATP